MDAQLPGHVPLVVATRGDAVESVHYGSFAVVDGSGRLVGSAGDCCYPVFTRSTLKPFQSLPFVRSGGPAHFGFSLEQVALLCASHSGEPRHVAAVADMLDRIGCRPADLQCGSHVPSFYAATGTPVPPDLVPNSLHHNCSGKHAGFLAWCRLHGQPVASYLDPEHPLQKAIRKGLAEFVGRQEEAMPWGVDGCSAPNYALPLAELAYAYARLAAGEGKQGYEKDSAGLFRAMTAHPEMVSGVARGDLILMRAAPGDWVAKAGAEGMQALGIASRSLGIAVKIADGNQRAVPIVVGALLQKLSLLTGERQEALVPWLDGTLRNQAGRVTGRLLAIFDPG